MSIALKIRLYLNSWRGIYIFFFLSLGHSSLIPTFCPMAFSVGGWMMKVKEEGGRGACVWPSPIPTGFFLNTWQNRVLPSMFSNKSQHLGGMAEFLLPPPHRLGFSFCFLCLSLYCLYLLTATATRRTQVRAQMRLRGREHALYVSGLGSFTGSCVHAHAHTWRKTMPSAGDQSDLEISLFSLTLVPWLPLGAKKRPENTVCN